MKCIKELHKYKIISIVGAGGKTSLMFLLAKGFGKSNKVLVTTTTKIYVPESSAFIKMEIGDTQGFQKSDNLENGVYIYGSSVDNENKLHGILMEEVKQLEKCFDYIIIESDGSKQKPLKGWRCDEPVIYEGTELTIGVIDIQVLGKVIDESNIHRLPLFLNLTDSKEGDKIEVEHLIKVITSKNGLFKNSIGKKMIFVNKVESFADEEKAYELLKALKDRFSFEYGAIGSAKNGKMIYIM